MPLWDYILTRNSWFHFRIAVSSWPILDFFYQVLYQDCITKVMNTNRWNLQEVVNINHANLNINRPVVIGCLWQSLCFVFCCILYANKVDTFGSTETWIFMNAFSAYCSWQNWIKSFHRQNRQPQNIMQG